MTPLLLCIALAQSLPQSSETVVVTATPIETGAASAGTVTAQELETRAVQRPADVLETIPGMIVSQHSGEGKANQYYLRGFDLDHGTDFATTVEGVPVNMPTHAHGQGYSDTNFLIPELISSIDYRKGPYDADEGDFSSAGAANIDYVRSLEQPIVSLTAGRFGYARALLAGSVGTLLGAIEVTGNNGPWSRPDDFRKFNLFMRYSGATGDSVWSVSAVAYDAHWNSTDQIPNRAVSEHRISRFGDIDPSDGGSTHRNSIAAEWLRGGSNSLVRANAYIVDYGLQLFSDFTYFLGDPINGDQFEQTDRRIVAGGRMTREWRGSFFGRTAENIVGFDVRHDHIGNVGLYHTRDRERLDTIRQDEVLQASGGAFAQSTIQWTPDLRTIAGIRADDYEFDVRSSRNAALVSPKLSVIDGPFYFNAGTGFHSNDARDPGSPLVRSIGAEAGAHAGANTFSLWWLDVDSELVYAGDSATTEARPASRRVGVEWSGEYRVSNHISLDANAAWSRARFRGTGERIPGALERVASAGIAAHDLGRVTASIRYRYLGSRPLIEDNSVRSAPSNLVTAMLGYTIARRYRVVIDGLNLLNAHVSDIDYYYVSRLPGEQTGGIADIHMHPVEPRAFRLRFEAAF